MIHFTSNTYKLKRKIINFTYKISKRLSKPEHKFTADITYDMLVTGSCLLTDVVNQLHEDSSHMSKSKSQLPKKTFIWCWSMALQNIH